MKKTKNSQIEDYICKACKNEFDRVIFKERFVNGLSYTEILLKHCPNYTNHSDGVKLHKIRRLKRLCEKFSEKMAAEMEVTQNAD